LEQVEKYIAYTAAHEIDSIINGKRETSHMTCVMKEHVSILHKLCKENFSDNTYVIKYNFFLVAMESTNVLHEKDEKTLGFPHIPMRRR
jgi:hypothetical protein